MERVFRKSRIQIRLIKKIFQLNKNYRFSSIYLFVKFIILTKQYKNLINQVVGRLFRKAVTIQPTINQLFKGSLIEFYMGLCTESKKKFPLKNALKA